MITKKDAKTANYLSELWEIAQQRQRRAMARPFARWIPILPYKGYTNYSTWMLCTGILNNPRQRARLITRLEKFEEVGPVTARLIANGLVRRLFPSMPEANWYHIDWRNVADEFNKALAEHRRQN